MSNSSIPLFFASDDNYAPMVATTILSVLNNTKSDVDFYILSDGISYENQEKIKSVIKNNYIEFIDVKELLKNFLGLKTDKYVSLASYIRLFIPIIKPNIDKVIYSDVDVIFTGDIKTLYNEDLNDKIIGAVPDIYYKQINNLNHVYSRLKLNPSHSYFYSGLLLIDCNKWRGNDVTSRLLNLKDNYKTKIIQGDQDLLNIYFNNNNYKELDVKYEVTNGYIHFYKELSDNQKYSIDNPVIRHYESATKPWNSTYMANGEKIRDFNLFWNYAKQTPFYDELKQNFDGCVRNENISFIMQGAIVNDITKDSLESLRKNFPGAEIILSTYDNADAIPSELYDKLIINEDPGYFYMYEKPKLSGINNVNRQIVSTLSGLKAASKKYAFKIRTDFILTGHNFVNYYNKFPKSDADYKIFKHKLIACTYFTRDPKGVRYKMPFHPSDIAFFGLREDLLNLFDIPLVPINKVTHIAGDKIAASYVPEQYIFISFLKKNNKDVKLDNSWQLNDKLILDTEKYFASNFIFISWNEFNLIPSEKFYMAIGSVLLKYFAVITHIEWQKLYKKHVDPSIVIPAKDKERKRLNLYRWIVRFYIFAANLSALFFIGKHNMEKRHRIRERIMNKIPIYIYI